MQEGPEQSYYPSARVTLTLRFDEYALDVVRKTIKPGTTDTKDIRGKPSPRGKLRAVETDAGVSAAEIGGSRAKRFVITDQSPKTTGPGYQQSSSPDNLTFAIRGIIPKSVDWKQNGVRKADTCKITIRSIDLPIDPRVVRSCAIALYLGCIPAEVFADGIAGAQRVEGNGDLVPLNVLPDDFTDVNGVQRSNLRFDGWVDGWEMQWSQEGEQYVVLECRDATHLLTLLDHPSGASVDPKKPIDEAIAEYLAQFPSMEGTVVEYRPNGIRDDETPPRLGKVLAGTSFQPHLGPPPAKGGGSAGGDNLNIWDYLTDVCGAIGHTIRVEGHMIVIQRLRDLLDGKAQKRDSDPYKPRHLPSRDYDNRAFIYGRNVLDLKVRKEFTKKAPTNIEVRCYNPRRKKVLAARFPEDSDNAALIARVGADSNDKKWSVIPVSGIESEDVLKWIAEDVYNSLGRNELLVTIKTVNLASFGGGDQDPDLLDMRVGDTIEILVNHEEDYNVNTEMAAKLAIFEKNRELMRKLGFEDELARAYAKAFTDANFQRLFRVKEVSTTWDTEDGIAFEIVAANYIEARADRPSDPNAKPVTSSALAKSEADRKAAARDAPKPVPGGVQQSGGITVIRKASTVKE